ncbi:MAG: T9SS type A sorting domain-containing protein [Dysgonamonadaceae bacterium]|jgi:hypothetical protein|nr:T9SS type A sorting domain-containing protein [Dysgonamonadaceae bacterium]
MKKLLYFSLLTNVFLFLAAQISAQDVKFAYDAAGNRISREITLLRSSKQEDAATELHDIVAKQEVRIFPNPTEGMLSVELPDFSDETAGEITIYDSAGKVVSRKASISRENSFDISRQANGIYIMKIRIGDDVSTWKIIKK